MNIEIELISKIFFYFHKTEKHNGITFLYDKLSAPCELLFKQVTEFQNTLSNEKDALIIKSKYDDCKQTQRALRTNIISALDEYIDQASTFLSEEYISDIHISIDRQDVQLARWISIEQDRFDEFSQHGQEFVTDYINLANEIDLSVKANKHKKSSTPSINAMLTMMVAINENEIKIKARNKNENVGEIENENRMDPVEYISSQDSLSNLIEDWRVMLTDRSRAPFVKIHLPYIKARDYEVAPSLIRAYFANRMYTPHRIPSLWKRKQLEIIEDLDESTREGLNNLGIELMNSHHDKNYERASEILISLPEYIRNNIHRFDSVISLKELQLAMLHRNFSYARIYGNKFEENTPVTNSDSSASGAPSPSPSTTMTTIKKYK